MKTRLQLFRLLGLDETTAKLAETASYKQPKERTKQEKEAIHKASDAIFKDLKDEGN